MKNPIFLIDSGDVLLFRTTHDLELYVESPDISGYVAYDSEGMRLRLISSSDDSEARLIKPAHSVLIDRSSPIEYAAEDLRQELAEFLLRLGARAGDQSLESLIAAVENSIGYTH